jgi:hypothetical protein
MTEVLTLDSRVSMGRGRSRKVSDVIKNKADVMKLIKSGHVFSDEVLAMVGIKRIVRESHTYCEIVEHEKDRKVYKKDNESLKTILKEILTIENGEDKTDMGDIIVENTENYAIDDEEEEEYD